MASLPATVAAARWDEFATGPSLSPHDVILPLLIVLVPALVINLVLLTRTTAPPKPKPTAIGK